MTITRLTDAADRLVKGARGGKRCARRPRLAGRASLRRSQSARRAAAWKSAVAEFVWASGSPAEPLTPAIRERMATRAGVSKPRPR